MHVQVQFYAGQQRPAGQRLGCTCLFFLKNKITIQLKTKTKNKSEIESKIKTKTTLNWPGNVLYVRACF